MRIGHLEAGGEEVGLLLVFFDSRGLAMPMPAFKV
jgi:hypothetical protein